MIAEGVYDGVIDQFSRVVIVIRKIHQGEAYTNSNNA